MTRWTAPAALLGVLAAAGGLMYALRPATLPEQPMPAGEPTRGKTLIGAYYCESCHGGKGQPTNADIPNLAGQQVALLYKNMLRFHHGQGNIPDVRVTSMINVFQKLDVQQIADMAVYLAAQKPVGAWPPVGSADVAAGQRLYDHGEPARGVIACAVCHGDTARGDPQRGTPSLFHQSPGYAMSYLRTVRAAPPGDQPGQNAMHVITQPLTDDELKNVSAYVASLTPQKDTP